MAEQVIPQKRSATEDGPKHYQLRSSETTEKPTLLNKFQPYISYKPSDFNHFKLLTTESPASKDFETVEDIPYNSRRGFQYSACSPNPLLPVLKFGTTDLPPFKPSLSINDRSSSTFINKEHNAVTTDIGWVSVRADVPIQQGKVYFEFDIVKSDSTSHVRIGLSRREASNEAPIGFDGYGYGLRDKTGQKLHLSRPSTFMKEGFKTGDVIGVLVELPKCEFQDIVRDQIAIRYRQHLFFEKFDYVSTTEMDHLLNPVTVFGEKAIPDTELWKPETLENSSIKIYKNGEYHGVAFEELYKFLPPYSELKQNQAVTDSNKLKNNGTLGYYPTISVFKGGITKFNPGPEFKFKPNDLDTDVQDYHELYNDRIAEETVWDLIDEIEAESIQNSIDGSLF